MKSNLGHIEAAAFHCALLKVVLMMQRRTFAPISKNFLVPNPEIDFESCPMQVQTILEPFPERPVVIGINSFGFGGANGHCVVREYRPSQPRPWSSALAPKAGFMIPLSARTSGALTRSAHQLREALVEREVDLYTLAGNLSRRRTHFAARTAFAVRNQQELVDALDAFVEEPTPVATVDEGERRVALVFAGQGTQWAGCGRGLYDAHPVFRRAIDAIEEHWREHSGISLREACFSAPQEELNEVQLAQPVIFMIQCALVKLLKTWGVYADCVVGHSSGEVAAAYASGALSLAEATRLVFHRATLQQRTAGSGRMLAIGLDRPGVEELLVTLGIPYRPEEGPTQVEIACENAPANTVICGREAALRPVMEELDRRNLQNQLLPGNIAFHSTAMNPVKDDALAALSFLNECDFDADVPFISSVTGVKTERLDNAYWWSNIRRPVLFAAAMDTIQREYRPDVVLEIAPHSALQPAITQCLEGNLRPPVCVPTLIRDTDVCLGFQEALGALFRAGVNLDFPAQFPRPEPIAHLLPGYPRDDQTASDEMSDDEMFLNLGEYSHGPLIGHRVPCEHLLFEARLSERDFPWLTEHRVHHASIMPAAGYIELLLQAFGGVPLHVETLEFLQPCPIPKTPVRLHTELFPVANAPDEFTFTISSRSYEPEAHSELHSRGKLRLVSSDSPVNVPLRLSDIDTAGFEPYYFVGESDFYERIDASLGETFQYGPYFQNIKRVLWEEPLAELRVRVGFSFSVSSTGQALGLIGGHWGRFLILLSCQTTESGGTTPMALREILSSYWSCFQALLFPQLEETIGALGERHQRFVMVLERVRVETLLPYQHRRRGCPPSDRAALARAFIAKAVFALVSTRMLLDRLRHDSTLRRLCGWRSVKHIPSEATFSRAFAEFADSALPSHLHEALIKRTQGERLAGHISRDSTAIEGRERPTPKAPQPAKPKRRRGRPRKGEERPTEPRRLERQRNMTLPEMLADLPYACDIGVKRDAKGYQTSWSGYKLHIDAADGAIPVSCLLTSASLHDSQVAIPLATLTAERVRNLYDLMDSAYDAPEIRAHSRALGHVAIIDVNPRSGARKQALRQERQARRACGLVLSEERRYRERSTVERVNGRLKDEFGGRSVRVRGHAKVLCHLMFGIVALTVDQLMRLVT